MAGLNSRIYNYVYERTYRPIVRNIRNHTIKHEGEKVFGTRNNSTLCEKFHFVKRDCSKESDKYFSRRIIFNFCGQFTSNLGYNFYNINTVELIFPTSPISIFLVDSYF